MTLRFSRREHEIIRALADGHEAKKIAGELGIAYDTVRVTIRNAMTKADARTRCHLVAIYIRGKSK